MSPTLVFALSTKQDCRKMSNNNPLVNQLQNVLSHGITQFGLSAAVSEVGYQLTVKPYCEQALNTVLPEPSAAKEPLTFYQNCWNKALPLTADFVVSEICGRAVEQALPNLYGAEKLISGVTGQLAGSVAARLAQKA